MWLRVGRRHHAESAKGIRDAVARFTEVIRAAGDRAGVRPEADRWSIVEYAAHLRDVLLSIRERIVLTSVLDEPTGTPLYREERIALGFYAFDTPADVAQELEVAARIIAKTISSLPPGHEARLATYSPATPMKVTNEWMAAQALHECRHHLGDVEANLQQFR